MQILTVVQAIDIEQMDVNHWEYAINDQLRPVKRLVDTLMGAYDYCFEVQDIKNVLSAARSSEEFLQSGEMGVWIKVLNYIAEAAELSIHMLNIPLEVRAEVALPEGDPVDPEPWNETMSDLMRRIKSE